MQKEFNKYQGAGNDFIIIDNRDKSFPKNNQKLIAALCDRRFGIGADGLILLDPHPGYDFEMHYYNSDGKTGTMCGNGGRCIYKFALDNDIVKGKTVFLASDGTHSAELTGDGLVKLSMNDVDSPESILGNNFLNTGSPHYIIPVPDVDKIDVPARGRAIRETEQFAPGGTNVNFVEIHKEHIKVRTYERGVEDETLSCGTGITASAISSKWGKKTGRQSVKVETRGGKLEVSFNLEKDKAVKVYLKGPAEKVFSGITDLEKYH